MENLGFRLGWFLIVKVIFNLIVFIYLIIKFLVFFMFFSVGDGKGLVVGIGLLCCSGVYIYKSMFL